MLYEIQYPPVYIEVTHGPVDNHFWLPCHMNNHSQKTEKQVPVQKKNNFLPVRHGDAVISI